MFCYEERNFRGNDVEWTLLPYIRYSLSLLVQADQSKSRLYAHSMTGKRCGWRECDGREDSNLDAVRRRKRTSI